MKCSAWSSLGISVSDRRTSRSRPEGRGWSLLGIWVCSACSVALLAAPTAAASVEASVTPLRVSPGADARLVFSVPNSEKTAITRVAIGLPPDFSLSQAEAKGGWRTEVRERTVAWEGFQIRPNQFANFALEVHAPKVEERAIFPVLASFSDGRTVTHEVTLTVDWPASPRDDGARTLATAALIVAAVATLLALGAGLLALWLWLRRPPF